MSGFCRQVDDNRSLLGYYAASSGNLSPSVTAYTRHVIFQKRQFYTVDSFTIFILLLLLPGGGGTQ